MDQVQIQCPNCKSVLLVKNTDGSNERVVNCPTCHTPLMVSFGNMAANAGSQPYNQTPYPSGPMPAGTGPMPQGGPTQQPISNEPKKNNTWVIALLAALVLALAGVLIWLLVFKDKDASATTDSEPAKVEMSSSGSASTQTSVAPEASLASISPEASASSVAISDDDIPEIPEESVSTSYSLPYLGNSSNGIGEKLYNKLGISSFVNVHGGMTGSDFDAIRSKDSSTAGNQLKVENSDGYRYQFFFMGSNKRNGRLTGVAVSHACSNPSSECLDFENYVAGSGDFTWVKDGLYRSRTGYYVSPGYSKGRFYVYYYLPNAPVKDPAPRN